MDRETDTLVLATGACREGDQAPDWSNHVRPGTTLVIYMGVRAARDISRNLISQGASPTTPVDVACNVSTDGQNFVTTNLRNLDADMSASGIQGKALIMVRFPKTQAHMREVAA